MKTINQITRSLLIVVILLLSSPITKAQNNNNLYPSPEPGLGILKEKVYKYNNDNNYYYHDLTINGAKVNGQVQNKQGRTKGVVQVYILDVKNEGMVSINLSTTGNLNKSARLLLKVSMNDPRNGSIGHNNDVQIRLKDKPNYVSVEKNYIYYAYPGVYYFDVNGRDGSGSDYKSLNYSISASQEIYNEQYDLSMGNVNDPDYPNYLGTTILSESLSMKGTRGMKNWRKPTTSGGISGVYKNSVDKFSFTASKTGTVNVRIANLRTTILDTYLTAYHTSVRSTVFQPKLAVNVLQRNVKSPLRTECLYGQELIDSFMVEAGVTYDVQIIGSNHPMVYALEFSYGAFGASMQ